MKIIFFRKKEIFQTYLSKKAITRPLLLNYPNLNPIQKLLQNYFIEEITKKKYLILIKFLKKLRNFNQISILNLQLMKKIIL